MINLASLYNRLAARRQLFYSVFLCVLCLFAVAIIFRPSHIATVFIDIGGVYANEYDTGILKFKYFEEVDFIEAYYNHENSPHKHAACNALVKWAEVGSKLKLQCRGRNKEDALNLISFLSEPLIARHKHHYKMAMITQKHKDDQRERRLQSLEKMVAVLQERPISKIDRAQSIAYQSEIENLREQIDIDRQLGNRVKETRVDVMGIEIVDRTPSWQTWLMVLVLAVGSGIFAVALVARPDIPPNA